MIYYEQNNMSTIQQSNSHIFTNRDGNTLMKEFEGVLQHNPQDLVKIYLLLKIANNRKVCRKPFN